MKLTEKYIEREVIGELLLIPTGSEMCNFNGVKTLNGTGKSIYRLAADGKNKAEIVSALAEEYECGEADVEADVEEFLKMLVAEGIIE